MIFETKWHQFSSKIKQLNGKIPFEKQNLLTEDFLLEKEQDLTIYYAPHNEYINTNAKVVIVGITPGWNQMKTAYTQSLHSLKRKDSIMQMFQKSKKAARFSGTMRKNLVVMLDQCGLAEILNIKSSAQLFSVYHSDLHTTSVIRYPVFKNGNNYTVHSPRVENYSMLRHYAYEIFPRELMQLKTSSLVIPLGKAAEKVVRTLAEQHEVKVHTYVFGFPHPSGANGHRQQQFQKNRIHIQRTIRKWKADQK